MKETLSIRLTRKFVGTYKYLDKWMPVGSYEVEAKSDPAVNMDDPEDPCEPTTQTLFIYVEPDEETQDNDVDQALEDCLGSCGCACEHDCCGCWSTYVTNIKMLGKNYWRVEICSSRNY